MARLKKEAPVKAAAAAPAKEKIVKKPAAKRSLKAEEEIYLQSGGAEWNISDCRERVVEAFTAGGGKASSVKKLVIYLKPEEGKAYYVVNDEENGSVDL